VSLKKSFSKSVFFSRYYQNMHITGIKYSREGEREKKNHVYKKNIFCKGRRKERIM